jgi:hypothetical protein
MFFKPTDRRLRAKRQRLEDEIMGYLIARKQPPDKLVVAASRIKMELDAASGSRA